MRKLKNGLAALAGLVAFGVAQASNWVLVPVANKTISARIFMDTESIRKQPNGTATVWFRTDYASTQRVDNRSFIRFKGHMRFACDAHQMGQGLTVFYDREGAVVQTVSSVRPMEDPPPDSVGESVMKWICPRLKLIAMQ